MPAANPSKPVHNVRFGPQAVADFGAVDEGESTTIDVLANDRATNAASLWSLNQSDPSAYTAEGSVITLDSGATVRFEGGRIVYDAGSAFDHLMLGETATDTFTYAIRMANGTVSYTSVTVTVTGTNSPPVANADTATTDEDTALAISVLTNDSDPDGDPISLTGASLASGQGSVSVVGNQVVFDPAGAYDHLAVGESATVTIDYAIADDQGGTAVSSVTVTVTGVNDGPDAVDDSGEVDENGTVAIAVLANDTDPDSSDVLTIASYTQPAMGGVSVDGAGNLVFDTQGDFDWLAQGESTSVSFTYDAADGNGGSDTATVSVTVTGSNDAPDAQDDFFSAGETGPTTLDVLANDSDPDASDALTITGFTQPLEGTVSLDSFGNFVFDPGSTFEALSAGQTATVSFDYTITDPFGATDTATATVTVVGAGQFDAPDITDSDNGTLGTGQGVTMTLTGPSATTDDTDNVRIDIGLGLLAQPIINVVYVVDISGSTSAPFSGSPVGDQNADGQPNRIIDAEIAGLRNLTNAIANLGFPPGNVTVSIIPFNGSAAPAQNTGGQLNPQTFQISNLSGINTYLTQLQEGGQTNYEAALRATINVLNTLDPTRTENNFVFFLSDGVPNGGGSLTDELATLNTVFDATISAVGVGSSAPLATLNQIDNTGGAQTVTTSDALTASLLGSPIPSGSVTDFVLLVDGVALPGIDETDLVASPLGLSLNVPLTDLNYYIGTDTTVTAQVTFSGGLVLTTEIDIIGMLPLSTD